MTGVDLNQQANRREQILFGLILVVLVIFFFKVLFAPQSLKIGMVKNQVTALQLEKEALERFLRTTPSLSQVESLSRKKGIKMRILYGEVEEAYQDLISLLNQLADPSFLRGVKVQKMSFLPAVRDNGFSKTDFFITVNSNFSDLIGYLERLEQFPALFSLEQISLRSDAEGPQLLEAEIQGRFFQIDTKPSLNKVSQVGGKP